MNKNTLYLIVFLGNILNGFAQFTFKENYGGSGYEHGRAVIEAADQGFVCVGATSSLGGGSTDIYFFKTDNAGYWLWGKTIGGSGVDWGLDLVQSSDSNYVAVGYTNSTGAGGYDIYLIKMDNAGEVVWKKTYGNSDWDFGRSIVNTKEGGLAFAGNTYINGLSDGILVKTNYDGIQTWEQTYDLGKNEVITAVKQTTDGGYILVGYTDFLSDSIHDIMTIKTDAAGDTVWTRLFSFDGTSEATDVIEDADGNFIISGFTSVTNDSLDHNAVMIKMDKDGESIWEKTYQGWGHEEGYGLSLTGDSGYVFVGFTEDWNRDVYLYMSDLNGDYKFSTTHGGLKLDEAYDIKATSDTGFVIIGTTTSDSEGPSDIYLVKTNQRGMATGLREIPAASKNYFYPNPFQTNTRLQLNKQEGMYLFLYDVNGKQVNDQVNIDWGKKLVNIQNKKLAPGIYFYSLFDKTSRIQSGRLIVTE